MSKRIGICFGDYNPMNQSHLDIIMHAKKESDIVYVIVCNYSENTINNKLNLNVEQRKRLINEYFKGDNFIRIIDDNDIGLYLSKKMSMSDWTIWTNAVKKTVVNNVMDHNSSWPFSPDDDIEAFDLKLTFYINEQYYDELLTELYYNTKLIKNNNINNVTIMQNPLLHWNKIIPTFKSILTHKIMVLGTESVGKSTLVKDIANYFQIPYTTEYRKEYIDKHNISINDLNVNDFINIITTQRNLYFDTLNSNKNNGIVISDTDNIMNLMYVKTYMKNIQITEEQYNNILLPLVKSLQTNVEWDIIYLIKTDNNEKYNILIKLLEEFNLLHKVVELEGTYIDYYDYIKNYINSLYENY